MLSPRPRGLLSTAPANTLTNCAFHHGGEVFDIPEEEKPRLAHLGVDISRMERGMSHLHDQFHHLTPAKVRYSSPGGMLGGLALLTSTKTPLYWLRTRQETSLRCHGSRSPANQQAESQSQIGRHCAHLHLLSSHLTGLSEDAPLLRLHVPQTLLLEPWV